MDLKMSSTNSKITKVFMAKIIVKKRNRKMKWTSISRMNVKDYFIKTEKIWNSLNGINV